MPYLPHHYDNLGYASVVAVPVLLGLVLAARAARCGVPSGRVVRVALAGVGFAGLFLALYETHVLFRQASEHSHQVRCRARMWAIGHALNRYARTTGRLPNAASWDSELLPFLEPSARHDAFRCPNCSARFGYAFNSALSNKPYRTVNAPSRTVAVFETNGDGRPRAGGQEIVAWERHLGVPTYVFADGSVRSSRDRWGLIWVP